jgi:hypothetical protein
VKIRCKSCGKMRDDWDIEVHKIDLGQLQGEKPGVYIRNIQYCADNNECYKKALEYRESKSE